MSSPRPKQPWLRLDPEAYRSSVSRFSNGTDDVARCAAAVNIWRFTIKPGAVTAEGTTGTTSLLFATAATLRCILASLAIPARYNLRRHFSERWWQCPQREHTLSLHVRPHAGRASPSNNFCERAELSDSNATDVERNRDLRPPKPQRSLVQATRASGTSTDRRPAGAPLAPPARRELRSYAGG